MVTGFTALLGWFQWNQLKIQGTVTTNNTCWNTPITFPTAKAIGLIGFCNYDKYLSMGGLGSNQMWVVPVNGQSSVSLPTHIWTQMMMLGY